MTWAAVLVTALGCYLLKLAGLSFPPWVLEHPLVERIADLLPVALLAGVLTRSPDPTEVPDLDDLPGGAEHP